MSSMAVAGLAKSLIAVTLTLNPAAAHHGSGSYTVRPGPPWLAGDAQEGHLLPVREEG